MLTTKQEAANEVDMLRETNLGSPPKFAALRPIHQTMIKNLD